jgi:uncharacterized protein (TIGR02271 family)
MNSPQPPLGIGAPVIGGAGDDLYRHYGLLPDASRDPGLPPDPPRSAGEQDVVVTSSQEQLRTDALNVVVGRARLITTVVTENQTFTVPVRRQEVRLVYDPTPENEQTIASAGPSEDTVEVILQAERVQITTQVVPVERVRMVRRVVTSAQTITEPVRSEQMALEQTDMPGPRPGDNQEETR